MPSVSDWKVPAEDQPKPSDYGYDLATAVASVGIGSGPIESPVTPVSCTFLVTPGPNVGSAEHWMQLAPERVSRIRKGLSGW